MFLTNYLVIEFQINVWIFVPTYLTQAVAVELLKTRELLLHKSLYQFLPFGNDL